MSLSELVGNALYRICQLDQHRSVLPDELYVGIDGISLWLVMLTTFIMPIAILSTWHAIDRTPKALWLWHCSWKQGMLGAFISLDLFLFYSLLGMMLVPMYFMIGIWGGKNRIYAAVKFFIFTAVGSLLMLVAIIYVYYFCG